MIWGRRLLAAVLSVPGTILFGQAPATLRTETRAVQIDVQVRDSHKQPVMGLTKDDFLVTDAGKRRTIQIFSAASGEDPNEGSARPATLPRSVYTNRGAAAATRGHSTVILLDAVNNYWDDLAAARVRLMAMLDQLRSNERIAVYAVTTKPAALAVVQDFTTDRERLRRSLKQYRPPAIEAAPATGAPRLPAPGSVLEEEQRRRTAILDTMAVFRTLSDHLGKTPGRKSLLWLTSGLPPKELHEMPESFEKAAASLNEANVAVDVLDDDGVGDIHRRWGPPSRWTLNQLADATGGRTYTGRNDLENLVAEAINTPRATYTLGFYLPDEDRDDRFHPLTVRVKGRRLELDYRKGYYAGPPQRVAPKQREPLENTLLDPQDSADIAITAQVTRLAGRTGVLRVAMRLGMDGITLREQDGSASCTFEELFLFTDSGGRLVAKIKDQKEARVGPAIREKIAAEGLPLVREIERTDGATRLLIVVRDTGSGRTGSLSVPLEEIGAAR